MELAQLNQIAVVLLCLLIVMEFLVGLATIIIGFDEQASKGPLLLKVAFSHIRHQFGLLVDYLCKHLVQYLNCLLVLHCLSQANGLVQHDLALLAFA